MSSKTWLTMKVERARTGLRSDVQAVIDALPEGRLTLALALPLPGFGDGDRRHVIGGVQIAPHVLERDGHPFLPVFTYEEPIARFAKDWRTAGGPLQICALPAPSVLELADRLVDGARVSQMIFDPGASSELALRRSELVSIREGKALPLVRYSRRSGRPPILAEQGPPPELVEAVRLSVRGGGDVLAHRVERWFDPEVDLEPRIVITVEASASADEAAIVAAVTEAARPLLEGNGETAEVRFGRQS